MQGADAIHLTSDLNIWKENNWDPEKGVVVVVSVRRDSKSVPFILELTTMDSFNHTIQRIELDQSLMIQQPGKHETLS